MSGEKLLAKIIIVTCWALISFCGKSSAYNEISKVAGQMGNRASAEKFAKKAMVFHRKKAYQQASELWLKAAKADPSWWKPIYNLGCAAALTGKKDEAISFLRLALKVEKAPKMIGYLRTDSDLKTIRSTQEFRKLLADVALNPKQSSGGKCDHGNGLILFKDVCTNKFKHFMGNWTSIGTTETKRELKITGLSGQWKMGKRIQSIFVGIPGKETMVNIL